MTRPEIYERILGDMQASPFDHATAKQEAVFDMLCADLVDNGDRLRRMREQLLGEE